MTFRLLFDPSETLAAKFAVMHKANLCFYQRRRCRLRLLPWPHERRTGRRTMHPIGLVLLSIAIMALLPTDADAKRRSSAQGSQAAGAAGSWCATYPGKGINDNCGYSSYNQCYQTVLGLGGFCRPNPFPGHGLRDRLHLGREPPVTPYKASADE